MNKLNKLAEKNEDFRGRKNYIGPFIEILKSNLKQLDERISCDLVNNMSQGYTPFKKPIPIQSNNVQASNNMNASSNLPSVDINVDHRKVVKCIVCGGPHSKLFNCKRLPLYVLGDNFKFVPRGVCKSYLYCGTTTRYLNCHKGTEKWICASSKLNVLICSQCPVIHKDIQAFFKAHHNANLTIKENFDLFLQTQKPRHVNTNNTITQV